MIKALSREELEKALPLVWDVFCEYEAINYTESGKQAFRDAIHSEDYLNMLSAYGVIENNTLVGIIATRNEEIKSIDLSGYKDSMAPLIQKDN